jgi:hypothetical protein
MGFSGPPDCRYEYWTFPKRQRQRYMQRNDSWGRVAPSETLAREVGMKRAGLRQGELWGRGGDLRR